jgi:hypothetical protein
MRLASLGNSMDMPPFDEGEVLVSVTPEEWRILAVVVAQCLLDFESDDEFYALTGLHRTEAAAILQSLISIGAKQLELFASNQ